MLAKSVVSKLVAVAVMASLVLPAISFAVPEDAAPPGQVASEQAAMQEDPFADDGDSADAAEQAGEEPREEGLEEGVDGGAGEEGAENVGESGEPGEPVEKPVDGELPIIGHFVEWGEGALEDDGRIPGELLVYTEKRMSVHDFLGLVPPSIKIERIYDIVDWVAHCEGEPTEGNKLDYSIFHLRLVDISIESADEAIKQLRGIAEISGVGYNNTVEAAAVPNDTRYNEQWGLAHIGAPAAWNVHTGINTGSNIVRVAILDSGIDYTHDDLSQVVNRTQAFDANTGNIGINADVFDLYGHGTMVAGVVGAQGNNSTGIAGVNWGIELVPMKITYVDQTTGDHVASEDNVAAALARAETLEIPIANMSYELDRMLDHDVLIGAVANYSGLFVIPSGNTVQGGGVDLDLRIVTYPNYVYKRLADLYNVVIVTAIDENTSLASFADYGDEIVDIAAPGVGILSTGTTATTGTPPFVGGYTSADGTSLAAPHVAGAAALLKSYKPVYTTVQLRDAILNYATPVAALSDRVAGGRVLSVQGSFILRADFNNNSDIDMTDVSVYSSLYYLMQAGDPGWDTPNQGYPPGREVDLDFNGVINMTDYLILYINV